MISQETLPELVIPAGDMEKLKFAYAYGADAVYAGVPIYSLRARENGFTTESLTEAIDYAHTLGKKIFLTMNIFAHNRKVRGFLDSFCQMADLEPDGIIMSDVGLISEALKLRPNTPIHLSTQANVTNWTAARFWQDLGIKRIILSRELSLKEINVIRESVPDMELEAFVHGAICVAYSGRCLISNYLNHRDANQGTCTNSCRWSYQLAREKGSLLEVEKNNRSVGQHYDALDDNYVITEAKRPNEEFPIDQDEHGTYLMNSKDLCAIELLAQLREAGVNSFKVEGRTKSVYYLAIVSRAYRRAIDDLIRGGEFNPEHLLELLSTSSRTMMSGFYLRRPQEYGENFEDGDSLALSHRFAGQVLDYDPLSSSAVVAVKNKFGSGDLLEWITPSQTVRSRVEELYDLGGVCKKSISGGSCCRLPAPIEANRLTLLRTPLEGSVEK